MSRPPATRTIADRVRHHRFKPAGVPLPDLEQVVLSLDEAEAVACADLDGLYQEAAARRMGVSRATFGRILAAARSKIADALINGKALLISGGPVECCQKRSSKMKIAIAVDAQGIEDHFGQCTRIRLYDVAPGAAPVTAELPLPQGLGCRSSLAPLLARQGVTHVIAARMGGGVRNAFESHGVQVLAGITGSPDQAVAALVAGQLREGSVGCEGHHDQADGPDGHRHGEGGCCHGH